MARRALQEVSEDDNARLTLIFRHCVARPPIEAELADGQDMLTIARDWYAEHPDDAKQLVGEYLANDVSVAESAAWVATARVFMNLDEFITRE